MSDTLLPLRSTDGLAALDIFYDEFNDVHFYVEDIDQENLYETILRKIFPELTIARIFPLGGKPSVLSHLEQNDSTRAIYILDKDFDDLLNIKINNSKLFYLERYCIENYLTEPEAIVEFIIECLPKLKRTEVIDRLDLDSKIIELAESMRTLFQLFYCSQRFNLGIKNSSQNTEIFCNKNSRWIISVEAVNQYKQIITEALSISLRDSLVDPLAHPEIAPLQQLDSNLIVSGKHLCTLLFHYLKSIYNFGTVTFNSFIFRLAKNCSLAPLNNLRDEINARLRSNGLVPNHYS